MEGALWRKKHGNSLRKASWRRGTTIGFGDFVPLHPSPNRDPEGYTAHVLMFTITSIIYFTIGLAVVSSVLLSIRNAMEERSLSGFHVLKDDGDD